MELEEEQVEEEQPCTMVYVVSQSDYECSEVKHVFSTLEAAMAYVEAEEPKEQWHTDYHLSKGMWGNSCSSNSRFTLF
jgi:hypothetical protein